MLDNATFCQTGWQSSENAESTRRCGFPCGAVGTKLNIMSSLAIHFLLVFSLLACPLRCLESHQNAVDESVAVGCGCCAGDSLETLAATPSGGCPLEGCACGDCICQGAISKDEVRFQPVTDFAAYLTMQVANSYAWPAPAETVTACNRSDLLRPLPSGRDVRVAHQSWLI